MKERKFVLLMLTSCFCLSTIAQTPKTYITTTRYLVALHPFCTHTCLGSHKGTTAIFVGGRYAYINSYKIRLDTKDILHPEAVLQKGKLFVPEDLAYLISQNELNLKPIPKGLIKIENKWVYKVERTAITAPAFSALVGVPHLPMLVFFTKNRMFA